uniref:Uncharacterized protein n=1 Tax=Lichen partiti-like RNA virus sp. TaxID=2726938 RepID=A0A6J4CX33_9VIRU|nr:hypothetical protein [Lichen partiti-like RNA virus sp.]
MSNNAGFTVKLDKPKKHRKASSKITDSEYESATGPHPTRQPASKQAEYHPSDKEAKISVNIDDIIAAQDVQTKRRSTSSSKDTESHGSSSKMNKGKQESPLSERAKSKLPLTAIMEGFKPSDNDSDQSRQEATTIKGSRKSFEAEEKRHSKSVAIVEPNHRKKSSQSSSSSHGTNKNRENDKRNTHPTGIMALFGGQSSKTKRIQSNRRVSKKLPPPIDTQAHIKAMSSEEETESLSEEEFVRNSPMRIPEDQREIYFESRKDKKSTQDRVNPSKQKNRSEDRISTRSPPPGYDTSNPFEDLLQEINCQRIFQDPELDILNRFCIEYVGLCKSTISTAILTFSHTKHYKRVYDYMKNSTKFATTPTIITNPSESLPVLHSKLFLGHFRTSSSRAPEPRVPLPHLEHGHLLTEERFRNIVEGIFSRKCFLLSAVGVSTEELSSLE